MLRKAQSREQLILEHLPQVRLIARRIHQSLPCNVNMDDLISAGTVGLITAIDRFDPAQGVKLKTYAEYKIRGAILDSLRTADWAPRMQRKQGRLIESAVTALQNRLHRTPTEEEVAGELGISTEEYREWATEVHSLVVGSLDSAVTKDGGRDLLQTIAAGNEWLPSEILESSELRRLVVRALQRMPQPERKVLTMYFAEERSLREISRVMNLHESRISQLKSQGLGRLRALLTSRWPERGQQAVRTASAAA